MQFSVKIDTCCRALNSAASRDALPPFDETLLHLLCRLYALQCKTLSLDRLRVSRAASPIIEWLAALGTDPSAAVAYTWLKGLALLGSPILPELAEELWRWLGLDGVPMAEAFLQRPKIRSTAPPQLPGRRVSTSDLSLCMPRGRAA